MLTTQNEYDRLLRTILPLIDGAKCLYSKNTPWYTYDVNDKQIPCGYVNEQIWDMRDIIVRIT